MLNFPEETHSRASALPASALMCTVGVYQCPLGISFFCGNSIWQGWLNEFHSEIWLWLMPTKRSQEVLLWLSCSPFVPLREKRKYSVSGEVEGMITFFRSLHKQVAKVGLWLLSALKQITFSSCYSMERVLSSPAL